ncbi:MAG: hypothetical protein MZV64_69490 [Ignavibacteriales bacterium]|nr:hypothetical protein [Ignavibacteriales bacterium]
MKLEGRRSTGRGTFGILSGSAGQNIYRVYIDSCTVTDFSGTEQYSQMVTQQVDKFHIGKQHHTLMGFTSDGVILNPNISIQLRLLHLM